MVKGSNVSIIPKILPSYKALYARLLLQYIDAAHGREPRPVWPKLPGIGDWKLSGVVLKVCRETFHVEEREPEEVWRVLHTQCLPFRLREFVITALWRKLPVAQRLQTFQVIRVVCSKITTMFLKGVFICRMC